VQYFLYTGACDSKQKLNTWMKNVICLATFGFLAQLFCSAAGAADQLTPECELDGSQRDINDCAAARLAQADTAMNTRYQEQLQRLSPANRERLRQSQRAWISYRNSACVYEAGPQKDLRSFWIGEDRLCRARLTKQRTEILKEYVECTSAPCPN
jgi:uncharacterized protein YecT (DUF1311 family)